MCDLIVKPNIGIGTLHIGMNPQEILEALTYELSKIVEISKEDITLSEENEEDGFSIRYLYNSYFFMVRYKDDKAIEISVDNEISKCMNVLFEDIDVFKTTVEHIVNRLSKTSELEYDLDNELLSTDYNFKDIGIRFWREEPFHESLLSDKEYMEQMADVIEEMKQYLYFQIITVR